MRALKIIFFLPAFFIMGLVIAERLVNEKREEDMESAEMRHRFKLMGKEITRTPIAYVGCVAFWFGLGYIVFS